MTQLTWAQTPKPTPPRQAPATRAPRHNYQLALLYLARGLALIGLGIALSLAAGFWQPFLAGTTVPTISWNRLERFNSNLATPQAAP